MEAVNENVLGPVQVGLERDGLSASVPIGIVADLLVKVVTDSFTILLPIGSTENIDAIVCEVEQTFFVDARPLVDLNGTWVQCGEGEKIVGEKAFLEMSEGIEHLYGALRNANVADLFACALADHLDVGDIVVEAHLCEAESPILRRIYLQCVVLLAVLGSPI